MNLLDTFLERIGLTRTKVIFSKIDFSNGIGKRLDAHRETVEVTTNKTVLANKDWHIENLAKQDDFLMGLFYFRYGQWPKEGKFCTVTREYVRCRPKILGDCKLPEYRKSKW